MKQRRISRRRLWVPPGLVLPILLAGCLCKGGGAGCGTGTGASPAPTAGPAAAAHGGSGGGFGSRLVDRCATIPAGAIPQPLGTHTNEIYAREVEKAEMDQFVIYLYEWQGDSSSFGPFGSRHIERIAARLPDVSFPVVIEPDCDRGINESRRLTVIAYLQQKGIAKASDVVRVGYPMAEGLYGEEAERIYRQMFTTQGVNNTNTLNNFNNYQGLGSGFGTLQGGLGGAGLLR